MTDCDLLNLFSDQSGDPGLLLDRDLHLLDLTLLGLVQLKPQERVQDEVQREAVLEPLPHGIESGHPDLDSHVRGRVLPSGTLLRGRGREKVPDDPLL